MHAGIDKRLYRRGAAVFFFGVDGCQVYLEFAHVYTMAFVRVMGKGKKRKVKQMKNEKGKEKNVFVRNHFVLSTRLAS
jgi:hypothetical protein